MTVEIGMPSWRAIAGELIRCRRSRSISATLSGWEPVSAVWAGAELSVMEGRLAARPLTSHPLRTASLRQADAEIGWQPSEAVWRQ